MKRTNSWHPRWIDTRGSVPPGTDAADILTRGIPVNGVFPERPPTGEEYLAFLKKHAKPLPIEVDDDDTETPALAFMYEKTRRELDFLAQHAHKLSPAALTNIDLRWAFSELVRLECTSAGLPDETPDDFPW